MRSKLASISFGLLLWGIGLSPARASPIPMGGLTLTGDHTLFFDDVTNNLQVFFDGMQVAATGGESFVVPVPNLGISFRDVDIYDPGSNALSDTIHLESSTGTIPLLTFAFQSGGPGITLTPSTESNRIVLTETGGPQLAETVSWTGGSLAISFQSDLDAGAVPESSAWPALFGAGLLLMLGKRVRGAAGI